MSTLSLSFKTLVIDLLNQSILVSQKLWLYCYISKNISTRLILVFDLLCCIIISEVLLSY